MVCVYRDLEEAVTKYRGPGPDCVAFSVVSMFVDNTN